MLTLLVSLALAGALISELVRARRARRRAADNLPPNPMPFGAAYVSAWAEIERAEGPAFE